MLMSLVFESSAQLRILGRPAFMTCICSICCASGSVACAAFPIILIRICQCVYFPKTCSINPEKGPRVAKSSV